MRIFDPGDHPTFGNAVWFALQAITTVGYGDSTPISAVGRIVTSVVMLVSIGLISVITAIITSIFIGRVRRRRAESDDDGTAASLARIEAAFAVTQAHLDQIEGGGEVDIVPDQMLAFDSAPHFDGQADGAKHVDNAAGSDRHSIPARLMRCNPPSQG